MFFQFQRAGPKANEALLCLGLCDSRHVHHCRLERRKGFVKELIALRSQAYLVARPVSVRPWEGGQISAILFGVHIRDHRPRCQTVERRTPKEEKLRLEAIAFRLKNNR